MRRKLRDWNGQRLTFQATVQRWSVRHGYKGPIDTVLLKDLTCKGDLVADHLWFDVGKWCTPLRGSIETKIELDARVTKYEKGYRGHQFEVTIERPVTYDYRLSNPTNLKILPLDILPVHESLDQR